MIPIAALLQVTMLGVTWLLVVGSVTIMAANTDITWDEYKVSAMLSICLGWSPLEFT